MRVTPNGRWGKVRTHARLCPGGRAPCTHYGVDLAAAAGTPVRAPESGIVRVARNVAPSGRDRPFSGYGPRVVLIEGDSGAWHLLAHLASTTTGLAPDVAARDAGGDVAAAIRAAPGVRVLPGQHVGTVAKDHLHWEVRPSPLANRERTRDPLAWLRARGGAAPSSTASSALATSSSLVLALLAFYVLGRSHRR